MVLVERVAGLFFRLGDASASVVSRGAQSTDGVAADRERELPRPQLAVTIILTVGLGARGRMSYQSAVYGREPNHVDPRVAIPSPILWAARMDS